MALYFPGKVVFQKKIVMFTLNTSSALLDQTPDPPSIAVLTVASQLHKEVH